MNTEVTARAEYAETENTHEPVEAIANGNFLKQQNACFYYSFVQPIIWFDVLMCCLDVKMVKKKSSICNVFIWVVTFLWRNGVKVELLVRKHESVTAWSLPKQPSFHNISAGLYHPQRTLVRMLLSPVRTTYSFCLRNASRGIRLRNVSL